MVIALECEHCGDRVFVSDDGQPEAQCPACRSALRIDRLAEGPQTSEQPTSSTMPVVLVTEPSQGLPMFDASAPVETGNPYQSPQTAASSAPSWAKSDKYLASRFDRWAGAFLDGLLYVPCALLGLLVASVASNVGDTGMPGLIIMYGSMLVLAMYQWHLIATTGQSLGKKWVGTQIVDYHDNRNPGFGRSVAMRIWLPGLIGVIPMVGPIFSLADALTIFGEERRCIHDVFAGTKVVYASKRKAAKRKLDLPTDISAANSLGTGTTAEYNKISAGE